MSSKKIVSNLIWRFAERVGAQLVSFVVSIVIARLLTPSDYGVVALITVFIAILQVFVDSGLGNALIQKKDADNIDFSTVFFCECNFLLSFVLLIIYCFAVYSRILWRFNDYCIYACFRSYNYYIGC